MALCMRAAVASLILSGLAGSGAVCAQEEGTVPGAIPDPSTYQGSMELQRQSDAQDQQFRAQQQQAEQPQYYQGAQPQQRYAPGGQQQSKRTVPSAPQSSDPATAAVQRGDYSTAFRITRPEAMRGDVIAQHNLGYLYDKGLGVPSNPALAVYWYRKSADQGLADGQGDLGRMYFEGKGVRRDPVEGYKWLLLAGRESATARQNMQQVGPSLSYDQMAEATQRAQSWKPVRSAVPPPAASQGAPSPQSHRQ